MKFLFSLFIGLFLVDVVTAEVDCTPVIRTITTLDFLSRDVELVNCKITLPKGNHFNATACAEYKKCYALKNTTEDPNKINPAVLQEVAKRHGAVLLKKYLDDYMKFEIAKIGFEKNNNKKCPSKLEVKASDSCDQKIMNLVLPEEKLKRKIKFAEERGPKKINEEFAHVEKFLSEAKNTFTADELFQIYKEKDTSSIEDDPYSNYLDSKMFYVREFVTKLNKMKPEDRIAAFENEVLENRKFEYSDGCDAKAANNNIIGMQNLCEEVTRISRGEVKNIELDTQKISEMYLDEQKDDLNLSYARCVVFNLFDKNTEEFAAIIAPRLRPDNVTTEPTAEQIQQFASHDFDEEYDKRMNEFQTAPPEVKKSLSLSAGQETIEAMTPKYNPVAIPDSSQAKAVNASTQETSSAQDNSDKSSQEIISQVSQAQSQSFYPQSTLGPQVPPSQSYYNPEFGAGYVAKTPLKNSDVIAPTPEAEELQTKLNDAEEKLAKLKDESEKTKIADEKKRSDDEIEKLKAEIEKLKTAQAASKSTKENPTASTNGSTSSSGVASTMTSQAPIATSNPSVSEAQRAASSDSAFNNSSNGTRAVSGSTVEKGARAVASTEASATTASGSARLSFRENIVDFPNVDLLGARENNPDILKYIADHPEMKSFPMQDKNKIVWTIIPSVDEQGKIFYTAIKEKKVADDAKKKDQPKKIIRAPAASVEVGPPKREYFLEKLNSIKAQ